MAEHDYQPAAVTMSSTLEGMLRFIAVMLTVILPALATYLNPARLGGDVRPDLNSA
jgi:hypothetical protein